MKDQLTAFLAEQGFVPVPSNLKEFIIYLKREYNFVNVVYAIELGPNSECTAEQYDNVRRFATGILAEKGLTDMHTLTIVMGEDVNLAESICEKDYYSWIIDTKNLKLIIPEGKVSDFYGMKKQLQVFLNNPQNALDRMIAEVKEQKKEQTKQKVQYYVPWVTIGIMIVNIIVYIICTCFGKVLYNTFDLSFVKVFEQHEYYRILTCIFLHADLYHLTANILMLGFAGMLTEREYGRITFASIYVASGIFSSISSLAFKWIQGEEMGSVGASGAIYGLVGAMAWFIILHFKELIRRGAIMVILLVVTLIAGLYAGFSHTMIDNAAHLGGLLAGFILAVGIYYAKLHRQKRGKG